MGRGIWWVLMLVWCAEIGEDGAGDSDLRFSKWAEWGMWFSKWSSCIRYCISFILWLFWTTSYKQLIHELLLGLFTDWHIFLNLDNSMPVNISVIFISHLLFMQHNGLLIVWIDLMPIFLISYLYWNCDTMSLLCKTLVLPSIYPVANSSRSSTNWTKLFVS